MPSYQYTAITPAGDRVAGELAAANEQAVLAELESRSLTPVSLATGAPGTGATRLGRLRARRPASGRQVGASYTQLADLLRAGVPLLRGLRLLAAKRSAPALARVWGQVADAVASGSDLAEAMNGANATLGAEGRRPLFAPIHVAMVRAGEKGGFIEEVLARLGRLILAQADLRARVIGSLIYPAILVVAGVLVLGVIFGVFIPMFRANYDRMPLGLLTRTVLGMSTLVREYGWLCVAVGVLGGAGLWRLASRPAVRARLAEARLRLPVIGPLARSLAAARFCRILGTMLANGIPLLAAMQIARDASGDPLMERAVDDATEAVRAGQPLAPPLGAAAGGRVFEEDVIEMIAVGEQANNLDQVLLTVADTLEARVDRLLGAAVKLIEPAMLVVLAAVIALVAMALILPMTRMGQYVGQ